MSPIFEGLFTEEETLEVNGVFQLGFKFSVSEARKKFDGTGSTVQIEEDRSANPSTQ